MRDDDDDDDEDDRPRRKQRHKVANGPPLALIVGIVGGVLLLIAVSLGAYFAFRGFKKERADEAVQRADPNRPNDPKPVEASSETAGWIDFQHPEGVFSARVPVKPVYFLRPKGGSIFAWNDEFFNTDSFVSTSKDLLASMDVRVFTQDGLEGHLRVDGQFGPKQFGLNATRKTVMWGGREAVEDRDDKTQISVRRRLYVGKRMYQFTIQGSPGRPTPAELATFFDSFQPRKIE